MADFVMPNFGNGVDVLSVSIHLGLFILGLIIIYGMLRKFSLKKKLVIFNPVNKKTKIIKGRVKSDTKELEFDDNIIKLAFHKNKVMHINGKNELGDEIYLVKIGENEYRYCDFVVDNDILKIVYNDNEKLAKEKFIKQQRLVQMRFQSLGDKLEKFIPYIIIAIIALAGIIMYDGMNKTQIEITKQATGVFNKAIEHDAKLMNGSYMIDYCKSLNSYYVSLQQMQHQQAQNSNLTIYR